MRWVLSLTARSAAVGTLCLCLSIAAFGASPEGVLSPEVAEARTRADLARVQAEAERLASKEVKAAATALYIQQLETQRLASMEHAEAAKFRSAAMARNFQSTADDLTARRDLLNAQYYFNFLIFFMVILVVAAGIWFSFLQFTADRAPILDLRAVIKELKRLPADDPLRPIIAAKLDASAAKTAHAFEVGPIKITSNVIGLVVLAISLAFFYLYVDRVYTLHMEEYGLGGQTDEKRKDPLANVPGGAGRNTPSATPTSSPGK